MLYKDKREDEKGSGQANQRPGEVDELLGLALQSEAGGFGPVGDPDVECRSGKLVVATPVGGRNVVDELLNFAN